MNDTCPNCGALPEKDIYMFGKYHQAPLAWTCGTRYSTPDRITNVCVVMKTQFQDLLGKCNLMNPWKLCPPHHIIDRARYLSIKMDMKENGWIGRPILAVSYKDKLFALTGSHRIAAARQLKINIPVYVTTNLKEVLIKDFNITNVRYSKGNFLILPSKLLIALKSCKDVHTVTLARNG